MVHIARCGCSGSTACNCLVTAGANVTVTGTGQVGNPYVVSANDAALDVLDTNTVDLTLTPGSPDVLSADVKLDPVAGNLITETAQGLRVDCATITASCAIGVAVDDTDTVDLTLGPGNLITADVLVDGTTPGNLITVVPGGAPGGLRVDCSDVITCFENGLGIDGPALDAGIVQVCLSSDGGNILAFGADGCLYSSGSAATPINPVDTNTVDLTLAGNDLSADVILDPSVENILTAGPAGLLADIHVDCGITGAGTTGNPLRANVEPAFPFACGVANGSDIYCDPATGQLKGDPEKFFFDQYRELQIVANATNVQAIGNTGVNVLLPPTLDLVVTNPSPCRPMEFYIEAGVRHAQLTKSGAAGAANVLFGADVANPVNPLPAFAARVGDMGHQQWGRNDTGQATWDSQGSNETDGGSVGNHPPLVLAPGASTTFRLRGHIQIVSENGGTIINAWQNFIRVTGHNV